MAFVPLDSRLTGPLVTTAAMAALFSDTASIQAMLKVEAALARAEAAHGLVPDGLGGAIAAIDPAAFDLAALGEATAQAGVPVIAFVEALQRLLPAPFESGLHFGATSQDIADTALVLQMRDAFALLAQDLVAVMDGLATLATAHRATPCAGRSYGQHAAPVTFGFKVGIWLAGIVEVAGRLADLKKRVLRVSLGGPVGTLAGLGAKGPAVARDFARELGLTAAKLPWHTRRAGLAETGAWLAMLIGALGKMATDIAHLASTEVGEVAEPAMPGRGGSSAMPHKRNPVSCTVILAAAGAAPGLAATLLGAMIAAHERPAGAWHAEWHALPSLFGLAAGALAEARRLACGLAVDPARMRANLDLTRGLLFADTAARLLAPVMGRAKAHALVKAAAQAVREGDGDLLAALGARAELPADFPRARLAEAFRLDGAIAAGARCADEAVAEAARVRLQLAPP